MAEGTAPDADAAAANVTMAKRRCSIHAAAAAAAVPPRSRPDSCVASSCVRWDCSRPVALSAVSAACVGALAARPIGRACAWCSAGVLWCSLRPAADALDRASDSVLHVMVQRSEQRSAHSKQPPTHVCEIHRRVSVRQRGSRAVARWSAPLRSRALHAAAHSAQPAEGQDSHSDACCRIAAPFAEGRVEGRHSGQSTCTESGKKGGGARRAATQSSSAAEHAQQNETAETQRSRLANTPR